MKLTNFEIKNDHVVISTDIGTFKGKDDQIQSEVKKIVEKFYGKYEAYFQIMSNSDEFSKPSIKSINVTNNVNSNEIETQKELTKKAEVEVKPEPKKVEPKVEETKDEVEDLVL